MRKLFPKVVFKEENDGLEEEEARNNAFFVFQRRHFVKKLAKRSVSRSVLFRRCRRYPSTKRTLRCDDDDDEDATGEATYRHLCIMYDEDVIETKTCSDAVYNVIHRKL